MPHDVSQIERAPTSVPAGSWGPSPLLGWVAAAGAAGVGLASFVAAATWPGYRELFAMAGAAWALAAVGSARRHGSSLVVAVVLGSVTLVAMGPAIGWLPMWSRWEPRGWPAAAVAVAAGVATGGATAILIGRHRRQPARGRTPLVRNAASVCAVGCYVTAVAWALFGIATFWFAWFALPGAAGWAIVGRRVAQGSRGAAVLAVVGGGLVATAWAAGLVRALTGSYEDTTALAELVLAAVVLLHTTIAASALPQALPSSVTDRIALRR